MKRLELNCHQETALTNALEIAIAAYRKDMLAFNRQSDKDMADHFQGQIDTAQQILDMM